MQYFKLLKLLWKIVHFPWHPNL